MNMKLKIVCIALLVTFAPFAAAGPAPEAMNFQGVLRDASGAPLDGSYDMTFRLYEFASAGTVLYTDAHLASGFGAVSVSEGLFTVAIGTGDHGNQVLSEVFRDHIDVWVEIEIGGEILSPRIQVFAAGHALNATNAEELEGIASSQFLRADQDDSTSGALTVQELHAKGQTIYLNEDGVAPASVDFGNGNLIEAYGGDTVFNTELRALELTIDSNQPFAELRFVSTSIPTSEALIADDSGFRLTDSLEVSGNLDLSFGSNIHIGWQEENQQIYFYEDGSDTGEIFYWSDVADAFYVTDRFYATGELRTLSSQIVIDEDGPNGNQDIEFFNGSSQFERFQWDAGAERFEVSDDFHAFGDLSTSGAKPFVQNHPHRDDLEIVYTAMEGNEVTTFTRGSGRLVDGEARIELEESFRYVTNPDVGLTASVTPRGESVVLHVAALSTHELVVRGDRDVAFDFVVYGLRIGYEDYPVYREKRAESCAPPPGTFAEEFADEPALADHTAIERYRKMAASAFGEVDTEMKGAWALREAIGMREPDLDFPRGSEIPVREMNRIALEKERGVADVVREEAVAPIADPSVEDASTPTGETAPQTAAATLRRDDDGNVYARSFRPSAGDIASLVTVDEPVEAGDVLVIDSQNPGAMTLGRHAGDTAVFGIVAGEPGVILGARDPQDSGEETADVPVAVSGVVLCKVDAGWGAIRPGDLLQTSPTPGHAMRADEPRVGGVLGKALDPMDVGTGIIRVLVTLR